MTQPPEKEGGISAGLNKKMGPFPVWLYLVLAGLMVFLFIYIRRQKSASSDTTGTDTQSSSTIPPFINQVYTNTTPPESSVPGPEGPPKLEKAIDKPSQIIDLNTAGTIEAIAKRWGMTVNQIIELNPRLANKYENTGKRIPRGTKIRVYKKA